MESNRKKWLWGLFALSCVLHFARLTTPSAVVFDEYHFGKFANAYCCSGARFFDIHPPHGKLLIAGAAKTMGYEGGFKFSKIGESYHGPGLFGLRFVPALAGALLPVLVFVLLSQLGVTVAGAFLGAFAVLFDNALLVQSRLIGLDLLLVSATLLSLVCLLAYMRSRVPWKRAALLTACGLSAGLAIGTKFTGLVVVLILGAVIWRVTDPWRHKRLLPLLRMSSGAFIAGSLVYALGWGIHFELLDLPGRGDLFYQPRGEFLKDTTETHKRMLASNLNLGKTHQDGSRWWQWPLMKNPVYYWAKAKQRIYFLGNPVIWWGSSFFLLGLLCHLLLSRMGLLQVSTGRQSERFIWIPLVAYFGAFLPFILINRVLFMYHYLTALVFGLIAVITWLDSLGWFANGGPRLQRRSYYVVLTSIFMGFVLVSPLTFGFRSFEWHHAVLRQLFVVL